MKNDEIAEILTEISEILEEQDDNPYRIRAYRRAARLIRSYPKNIEDLVNEQFNLMLLPNIGKKLADVIKNIILEGKATTLQTFSEIATHPPKMLNKKKKKRYAFRIYNAKMSVDRVLKRLSTIPYIKKMECSGEYRRKKEIIDHVLIIIVTENRKETIKQFLTFPIIKYILQQKPHSITVQLKAGLVITLFFTTLDHFDAMLFKTTGSDAHIAGIQKIATKNKLKLTNHGLIDKNQQIVYQSEEDIYKKLQLQYIPPELRENQGEIIAASRHCLPKLIQLTDIRGDLHCHTNETDGSFTLEEMVNAAAKQGYEYIAITDHSKNLKITRGMDEKRLFQQIKLIDKLNEKFPHIQILKSIEVDILENGELDLSHEILKELDLTVCSIHSKFHLSKEKQTERIIRAMHNPYFNILGHATGRLLSHRLPYDIDFDAIFNTAKTNNCFFEINAQPARLDINDIYCKMAKERGLKFAISSDAHTLRGFGFMILGVNQARRGWLEAADVINTYKLPELKRLLRKN